MLDVMKFRIDGTAPLLLHNGQLADPGNRWSKAMKKVSSKRNKTDEDFAEMASLEWMGGLYLDPEGVISIPADVLLGCVLKGGKQFKLGPKINAGVFETGEFTKLQYQGSQNLTKLYEAGNNTDSRLVVIQRSRIMRTRPIFRHWSLDISLNVNTDVIDLDDVERAIVRAGEVIGMGDYRPRYGRFIAVRL